jgi:hypothetical protein
MESNFQTVPRGEQQRTRVGLADFAFGPQRMLVISNNAGDLE